MSDLVEEYAQEKRREGALQALLDAVRSLMERGGVAPETTLDLLSVPEPMAAEVRLVLGA